MKNKDRNGEMDRNERSDQIIHPWTNHSPLGYGIDSPSNSASEKAVSQAERSGWQCDIDSTPTYSAWETTAKQGIELGLGRELVNVHHSLKL